MLTSEYQEILNPLGLHLRAARQLVELANKFEAKVEIEKKGGPTINGKSILGVLLLEGIQGTKVRVLANGVDARDAIDALTDLVSRGFGEI